MCRAIHEAAFYSSNHLAVIRRHVALDIHAHYPHLANRLVEEQQASDLARGEMPTSLERLLESEVTSSRIAGARYREIERRFHGTEVRDESDSDMDSHFARVRSMIMRVGAALYPAATGRQVVGFETLMNQAGRMTADRRTEANEQANGGAADQGDIEVGLPALRRMEQRVDQALSRRMQILRLDDSWITSREGVELDETHEERQREHGEVTRVVEQWDREGDNV